MTDHRHPATTAHNYVPKVLALVSSGRIPGNAVSEAYVRHASWCDIERGRFCNCDPEIHLEAPAGVGAPHW